MMDRITPRAESTRPSDRERVRRLVAANVAALVVLFQMLASWRPILTPDGIDYLHHAADIPGIGLTQFGFRQVGYPMFLAVVDILGGGVDPHHVDSVAFIQRALLLVAAGVVLWCLRWWSVPILVVVLSPQMAIHENFILTEAIGIPIAVMGAAAVVGYAARSRRTAWLAVATGAAVLLPVIRLHWVVVSGGLCLALLWTAWNDRRLRSHAVAATAIVVVTTLVFTVALALENDREYGIFHPSIGAQRQLYWTTWVTVVPGNESLFEEEAPDIYGNGSPFPFLLATDSSPLSLSEREAVYAHAVDVMYGLTGESQLFDRVGSAIGVITGSRYDDLGIGDSNHPIAGLPTLSLHTMMRAVVVLSILLSLAGVWSRVARPLAGSVLAIAVGYACVSFIYPLDNLRFLLPAYVAMMILATGSAMFWWRARAPAAGAGQGSEVAKDRTRSM